MFRPVRKAITRSRQTYRVKFPSLKNNAMMHCESILEADTALYLEMSPHVKAFRAQPSQETYYDKAGNQRIYYPDFRATLNDDSELDIEVKLEAKLRDPRVKGKLEAVIEHYDRTDRMFRIVTDRLVRAEPLRTNLKILAHAIRTGNSSDSLRELQQALSHRSFLNVDEASSVVGSRARVYRLIAAGVLTINFNMPLNGGTQVWFSEKGGCDDSLRI